MRRNSWGWFDHLRESKCECQSAEWVEAISQDTDEADREAYLDHIRSMVREYKR
jgi:hypothetical protein